LEAIYNELFQRMVQLEEEKYDINALVSEKDAQINELTIAVNDLRGKFVKPALKKVSKYDNKFKKGAVAAGEAGKPAVEKQDFRSQLKVVKRENIAETLDKKVKKSDKPEWSKGAKKEAAPAPPPKEEEPSADDKPAEEPAAEEPEEEIEEDEGEEEEEE